MIHRYELNGYRIVLDVYSGSVHVVDEVAYDMIGLYEERGPEGALAGIRENTPIYPRRKPGNASPTSKP